MAKVKLTKGELKRQRDASLRYERYLPILQLKKQQLQLEILRQVAILEEKEHQLSVKKKAAGDWSGLLCEGALSRQWLAAKEVVTTSKNIAGVDIPIFIRVEFNPVEYDLFTMPLWLDSALEALRGMVILSADILAVQQAIAILKHELRITAQRVNLFEKVKIPEAKEAIRVIKIFIGDQMANAVGRSKIAKSRLEETMALEVAA